MKAGVDRNRHVSFGKTLAAEGPDIDVFISFRDVFGSDNIAQQEEILVVIDGEKEDQIAGINAFEIRKARKRLAFYQQIEAAVRKDEAVFAGAL